MALQQKQNKIYCLAELAGKFLNNHNHTITPVLRRTGQWNSVPNGELANHLKYSQLVICLKGTVLSSFWAKSCGL